MVNWDTGIPNNWQEYFWRIAHPDQPLAVWWDCPNKACPQGPVVTPAPAVEDSKVFCGQCNTPMERRKP